MKLFLTTLAVTSLTGSSIGSLITINNNQITNIAETKQITIHFQSQNKENYTKASYKPNYPKASFHYFDITKRKENSNSNIKITLNNINYKNQQTKEYSKSFDYLTTSSTVFESTTLGNPIDWDDEAFHLNTETLYSYTIQEGVTKYTGDLAVAVTKDTNTGNIYFVWGVYGEVILGSNQGIVSTEAQSAVIEY